jgi:nitroreductase
MTQMAETPETIKSILERQSCRYFRQDELPAEHLELLLECLRWTPSAGNMQPWRFYVVKDAARKRALVQAAFGQKFIGDAPVVIVVCAVPEESAARYGQRGATLYCLQDTAAAVQNLLLGATALGYGTCWIGAFDESAAAKALNLPKGQRPVAMVPVGKPARVGRRTDRRPRSEIVVE